MNVLGVLPSGKCIKSFFKSVFLVKLVAILKINQKKCFVNPRGNSENLKKIYENFVYTLSSVNRIYFS